VFPDFTLWLLKREKLLCSVVNDERHDGFALDSIEVEFLKKLFCSSVTMQAIKKSALHRKIVWYAKNRNYSQAVGKDLAGATAKSQRPPERKNRRVQPGGIGQLRRSAGPAAGIKIHEPVMAIAAATNISA
jgi:hypothetical protein